VALFEISPKTQEHRIILVGGRQGLEAIIREPRRKNMDRQVALACVVHQHGEPIDLFYPLVCNGNRLYFFPLPPFALADISTEVPERISYHRERRESPKKRSTSAPIVEVFIKESMPGKQQEKYHAGKAGEQHCGRDAPEQACGCGGNWSEWSFRRARWIKNAGAGQFARRAAAARRRTLRL
jgi:hypothetical protein